MTDAFCSGVCLSPSSVGIICNVDSASGFPPNSVNFSQTLAVKKNNQNKLN